MIIGTLIAVLIGGLAAAARYSFWPKNVPVNVSKFRWVIAFFITILAIAIEVAMKVHIYGLVQVLNGVLLLSIVQVLKNNSESKIEVEDIEYSCSDCNTKVDESDKYCHNCGAEISEQVVDEAQSNESVCPNCGNNTIPAQKFCTNCGHKLL